MRYELFISLRYLRAKRREAFISLITLISILGVTLGVTVLILVISVMTGFDRELRQKVVHELVALRLEADLHRMTLGAIHARVSPAVDAQRHRIAVPEEPSRMLRFGERHLIVERHAA